jgi:hypothetical protein
MDVIRLNALFAFWEEYPPNFMVMRGLMGDGRSAGRRPSHRARPGETEFNPPRANTFVEDVLLGPTGGGDFVSVSRVPPDYYRKFKEKLEADTAKYIAQNKLKGHGRGD